MATAMKRVARFGFVLPFWIGLLLVLLDLVRAVLPAPEAQCHIVFEDNVEFLATALAVGCM